jgi:choline-sulfatase
MTTANQPNIIYVMCDELRWSEVACYGHPHIKTPNMDRLAKSGVRFEVGVSNCPVCMPARSAVLSGQYARTCSTGGNTAIRTTNGKGIMPQWPSQGRDHLPDQTLPECLKQAGYTTAAIGKWHVENWPNVVGFDHWIIPAVQHANTAQWYCENGGELFSPPGYGLDYEAKRVNEYLDQRKADGQSFYLYYNMSPPHMPLMDAPKKYLEMYGRDDVVVRGNVDLNTPIANQLDRFLTYLWDYRFYRDQLPYTLKLPHEDFDLVDLIALYMGLTTWVDDALGQLLDHLEQTGLAQNTIVVFTADHGDNLGSWGDMGKGRWNDESARVPMMVAGLGVASGVVSNQVASLIDWAPTFITLAGGQAPLHMPGKDLTPVITGQVAELEENHAIIESTHHWQGVAIRTPQYLLGRYYDKEKGRPDIVDEVGECFDVLADPFSLNNLAGTDQMPENWRELNQLISDFDQSTPRLQLPEYAFGRQLA